MSVEGGAHGECIEKSTREAARSIQSATTFLAFEVFGLLV